MRTFIGVDLQRDFMYPEGKLYVQGSKDILENIFKFLNYMNVIRDRNISIATLGNVLLTSDSHTKESKEISETPDYINTFPEHCMLGTEGMYLIREVMPMLMNTGNANIQVFFKDTFSIFDNAEFNKTILNMLDSDVVNFYVFGVATEFCVKAAVEGLYERISKSPDPSKYSITVLKDMIAGVNEEKSEDLLKVWESMGIRVATFPSIVTIHRDSGIVEFKDEIKLYDNL